MGCRVTHNVEDALAEADVVDLLRIQHERQRLSAFPSIGEYRSLFGPVSYTHLTLPTKA